MSEDKEMTLWDHIVELSERLRRALVAFIIAAVIASALPLELFMPLAKFLHIQPGGSSEHVLSHMICYANVTKKVGEKIVLVATCRPVRINSSSSGIGFLHFNIQYTPLIVKVPEFIVGIVLPREVCIAGRCYKVVLMPASAFETFEILLLSAALLGFIVASPFIVREIWAYIEPALYPHEKRLVKRYSLVFLLLFLAGVALAICVIAPLTYRVTLSIYPYFVPQGYEVLVRVSVAEVVKFAIELALATGIVFETPLVLYILITHGVISAEAVEKNLKYVFLAAMIIGAIISPDPSGLGMVIIGLALYIPIHVAVKMAKKKLRERSESDTG